MVRVMTASASMSACVTGLDPGAMNRLPDRTALGYVDEAAGGWRTNIFNLPIIGASDAATLTLDLNSNMVTSNGGSGIGISFSDANTSVTGVISGSTIIDNQLFGIILTAIFPPWPAWKSTPTRFSAIP